MTQIGINNLVGRIGSYAISTIEFDSWMNEPIKQAPQRTRKTRVIKEVVNKIFVECANVIDDPYWIEKFNMAAKGKFPRGFSYNDNILVYRKGAKSQQLEVSGNPYEAAYACMEFFRYNGGLFSQTDEQDSLNLQHIRSQAVLTQQQLTWGDANKKIQECMLSHYVIGMKSIMSLSDSEMEQLRQTIRLGISNKFFGKHNINLDNNRIHTINGLLWNNEERIFYINPELKPVSTRTYTRNKEGYSSIDPCKKDTIPQFGVKWYKYIESLDKKIIRNNRRLYRIIVTQQYPHAKHLKLSNTADSFDSTSEITDENSFNSTNTDE